jgi:hypothetical protein
MRIANRKYGCEELETQAKRPTTETSHFVKMERTFANVR